ncbi:MAG: hypothetical protein HQ523_15125 [Lentisphaerae bacterium]|nr:hypothetical protein [Lentisphaerota bacterium]
MANLAQVLKEEIRRLARKEVRLAQEATRKEAIRLRKANSELKARVAKLEKIARTLNTTVQAIPLPEAPAVQPVSKERISGKGVRSLRKRLKLTRAEFAALAETTSQTVYNWEKQDGVLTMRNATGTALIGLRGIGIKEARTRLAAIPVPVKTASAKKKAPVKKKVVRRKVAAKK